MAAQLKVVGAQTVVPNVQQIMAIPLARSGEFELTEREMVTTRRRIYSINKNNAAGWRFRTMREGRILLVWRIH